MKARLGLRQIYQVLRHAFLLESAFNHFAVASAALEGMFQGPATTIGKVVDIACNLVRHHQWQVGVCGFNLFGGFCFQTRINRVVIDLVGFVDGRGLGLLWGRRGLS